MSADLFTSDLGSLRYEDIASFLALQQPPDARPREGVRCDWKGAVPSKLGETVTAFANTIGGLIFIGVEEGVADQKGLPVAVPGIARSDGDLKTRLTQMITSTVNCAVNCRTFGCRWVSRMARADCVPEQAMQLSSRV